LLEDISSFQRDVMHVDGDRKVEPHSETFRAMAAAAAPRIRFLTRLPVGRGHGTLTDHDYAAAAASLGCAVEAIKAVSMAESRGAAFLSSGRPKILYEPHAFGKKTAYKYNSHSPDLSRSGRIMRSRGESYGSAVEQYVKVQRAMLLDREKTLSSTSWGRFQILGQSWREAGASSLDGFIETMFTSERRQLDAFVAFVRSKHLVQALKTTNWPTFAEGYNGPDYKKDNYDGKIAAIYRELVASRPVAKR
jgi:hypothetical protein